MPVGLPIFFMVVFQREDERIKGSQRALLNWCQNTANGFSKNTQDNLNSTQHGLEMLRSNYQRHANSESSSNQHEHRGHQILHFSPG